MLDGSCNSTEVTGKLDSVLRGSGSLLVGSLLLLDQSDSLLSRGNSHTGSSGIDNSRVSKSVDIFEVEGFT